MRKLALLLLTSAISLCAHAQNFPWGQVDNAALNMTRYDKDTSAHAVVLQEYGSSRVEFDNDYDVKLIYEYHAKIKFFDNKDFDENGTISVPIYHSDGLTYEQVEEIKGITFYKDDNGLVQKAELDPKKVYREKKSAHTDLIKFAMPAIRNGCIIEVTYKIFSPYLFNFQSWEFQSNIPKMYSEYQVHIPAMYNYNASLRGKLKLTKNTAEVERKCFTYGTASCDCSNIIYGMSDVPAFIEEDYMTSKHNYLSAINFELIESTNLLSGVKTQYTKDWKAIDVILKTDEEFGSQLKRTSLLKDRIGPVIVNRTDSLEKAKAIYAYIQKNIKWNGQESAVSLDGIRKALDSHAGNSADINLSLVAALNAGGIPAEAVLLSTRAHGLVNNLYPTVGDFNYVVAMINVHNKDILLDATDPLLPFGILPLRCLNDKGRVFSLNKPSYWMDMNLPQKEKSTHTLDLTLQDNGKLKGTLTTYSMGYDAYERRAEIKKYNNVDEYVDKFFAESPKVKVIKSEISNLDSLDQPLTEKYELEIDIFDKLTNSLTFSPFFWEKISTNPFKLKERSYPVDWGMASDDRMILTVHLPSQYTVQTPPQAIAIGMPNNGGKFVTSYESSEGAFTFSHVIQFNKSVYGPEEYPYLKELYNKIIQSEKAEMVFKKKS